MARPVVFRRGVGRDLAGGFAHYEEQSEGLGVRFLDAVASIFDAISLMHCMPVSLAVGGKGLGTVWGEQLAREMLAQAGFGAVEALDTPRPQNCMFVCRP